MKADTLREEFYLKIAEFAGPENSAIDPYPMQRIADWWIAKLEADRAFLREKVEGMRRKEEWDTTAKNGPILYATDKGYNVAIDKVLALLTPKN